MSNLLEVLQKTVVIGDGAMGTLLYEAGLPLNGSCVRGKENKEGEDEGLKIAGELAAEVLRYFKGIYLITPLIRYEVTVQLSSKIRSGSL